MRNLHLYDQQFLAEQIKTLVNDADNNRWTDAQVYSAMNMVFLGWEGNVSYPNYYDVTSVSGTYDYTLPFYVGDIHEVLWREDATEKWVNVRYRVRRESHESAVLTLENINNGTARVVWYSSNKVLPTTLATLDGTITDSATTLDVTTSANVAESGYIRVNSEIIYYADVTARSATGVTLSDMTRGIQDTTAAAHDDGDTILWCVAADRTQAINELVYKSSGLLHGMVVSQNTPTQRQGDYSMMKAWLEMAERQVNQSSPVETIEIKGFIFK